MSYPLLTPRLSIEPLSKKDLATFVAYRQDPEIARYQGWDTSYSEQEGLELLDSQFQVLLPGPDQWLQLAIHDLATGDLLGDLALHSLDSEKSSFEIGFTLAKANHGNGFAKEAVSRIIQFLFEEVNANSIVANCDERNLSAIGLLKSLNFDHKPEKSWTEEFKNEQVTVNHFELVLSQGET